MNSFKIIDKNGEAVRIKKLDEEAARFWGKEVHPKKYAFPGTSPHNWYDVIGWAIAFQGDYTKGWKNVALYLLQDTGISLLNFRAHNVELTSEEDFIKHIRVLREIYEPFIALINYWSDKGYEPVQIKDE